MAKENDIRQISIEKFRRTIVFRLPADKPNTYKNDNKPRQKWHWFWWLLFYNTAGAYGRQTGKERDAKFAYNHAVCPELLLYLVDAIPLDESIRTAAHKAYQENGPSPMAKSGAIRKVVPWLVIYQALWGDRSNKPFFS